MSLSASKLTEMPLRSSLPLASHSHHSSPSFNHLLFFSSAPKPSFHILRPLSSLRTKEQNSSSSGSPNRSGGNHRSSYPWSHQNAKPSAPWLDKWPSSSPSIDDEIQRPQEEPEEETTIRYFDKDKGKSAIERIVLRLRNLGLGSDDEEDEEEDEGGEMDGRNSMNVTGDEKLGDLLRREWVRPDTILAERERNDEDEMKLPWERSDDEAEKSEGEVGVLRKRRVKAPTLAELTIEDEELRRLRRMGMYLRERINVPKAGITQAVLEKIHDKWKKEELVRLKFHEVLARDMKTAHEIVERRTGGLIIWRSGSVMVVYRGGNYEGPSSKSEPIDGVREALFVPDVSTVGNAIMASETFETSTPEKGEPTMRNLDRTTTMTEEEAEYNSLLDGLGPRFHEWWGTGVLPVDADLLPPKIPGYKTPFRLLPTGMRSRLTNAEMTNLRKVAKSLPCHFALGRNRNHQGLAAAIIKLWEKSLVAKIAVKRGIQNTNNKLMAEELKSLTGGVLLLRNKYYIVIYRGKDFLPTSVASTLSERQELTKEIQDVEEKVRSRGLEAAQSSSDKVQAPAGTLAEFYEAQARWGRDISHEEREKMVEEASRAQHARLVKRIEHKLAVAQAKKLRAERLLAKIEVSMVPSGPDYDQETITDEERVMFRRVGLRMKAYLPVGIRGVFDGVIENMHLHWKHRELVKLITKQKTLAFVEDTARLLEYESGGILVAIERVPKGYALIYYRGKNYRRPISLRPRNLLTKAKALKRSVAMQRHEALSQHISELEKTIEQMKEELGVTEDAEDENDWSSGEHGQFDHATKFTQTEDATLYMECDSGSDSEDDEEVDDDNSNIYWETDEESVFSGFENCGSTLSKND